MRKFQCCKENGLVEILNFYQAILSTHSVTKKWAGVGNELFTSADNYVLDVSAEVPATSDLKN